jgi:hypothetical protein
LWRLEITLVWQSWQPSDKCAVEVTATSSWHIAQFMFSAAMLVEIVDAKAIAVTIGAMSLASILGVVIIFSVHSSR